MGRLKSNVVPVAQAEASLTLTLQNWLLARRGSAISKAQPARIANSRVELTAAASGIPYLRRSYSHTLRLLLGTSMAVLLGTKLMRGRVFDEHDTPGSRRVAVVTNARVPRYFGSRDPIGRTLSLAREGVDLEIVGVVESA